eukprot:COSAG02_NODE_3584_length_6524_cov_7.274934_4_plen_123_part_00
MARCSKLLVARTLLTRCWDTVSMVHRRLHWRISLPCYYEQATTTHDRRLTQMVLAREDKLTQMVLAREDKHTDRMERMLVSQSGNSERPSDPGQNRHLASIWLTVNAVGASDRRMTRTQMHL